MEINHLIEAVSTALGEARGALNEVPDAAALERAKSKHLGRRSALGSLRSQLGAFGPEDRRRAGQVIGEALAELDSMYSGRRQEFEALTTKARLVAEGIDVSLAGRKQPLGALHPLTQVLDEIIGIFSRLGYKIAEGPEIETDWYNFEALNIAKDHPARMLQDTFYLATQGPQRLSTELLLRTQTSPMQIRIMESTPPPIYVISPGRVFRRDTADPSHLPQFHQVEGLAVDEGISMAHLKGTLELFAREMFGESQRVRLLPSYFPFTEPSAEVEVSCASCDGAGCRTCGQTGWLEIMGAGMVHPNVFASVGYNPDTTGFAFGMGVERIAMLRYSISDIRTFYENDVRFLEQFA